MIKTPNDLVAEASTYVPQTDVEAAKALHGPDGVLFLDVRESGEVAGAVMIPLGVLEW